MEPKEIDPIRYGVLWERVQNMDKKMDKMEREIGTLLELANRSRGGLWAGMAIASALSGLITSFISHFKAV